jgi:hypothetical protein
MKKNNKRILLILLIIIIIIILLYYLSKERFENSYNLPKIVWSYWDSDDMPEQIKLIYENNKKKLDGWDYKLVNNSNKKEYLGNDDIYNNLEELSMSTQQYSDWLRLYLLKKYGGVWLDISIIINSTIDDLYSESVKSQSELTGFNSSGLEIKDINIPVIESWFIMAPINSEVISLWYKEFDTALKEGLLHYKRRQIKDGVKYQNIFGDVNVNESEIYLSIHGCLQVVLQKKLNRKANIINYNATDTMFKLQSDCKWDAKCLQEKINDKSYSKKIPYIKLRGIDRKNLDLTTYFKD